MSKSRLALLALGALLIAACGREPGDDAAPASEIGAEGRTTLRVMSFNIEWGGTHVSFDSVVEAIRAADADIVGVQEAEGNLERLADELGWHFSRRNYVISRFPLVDPAAGAGRYLFAEIAPGQVVAVGNVHLPSSPAGEDWFRSGRAAPEVAEMERQTRLPAIEPVLDSLSAMHRAGMPTFLTGDFNAPSHADWTDAAIGKLPHRDRTFEWPVSTAVAEAGFRDSFRSVHADPVARPGFTWWAARPRIEDYNPSDPTHRSRIDFVWFAGPVEVVDSLIVGEKDGEGIDIGIDPWPSDHRAVLSVFEAQPSPMPELITTSHRVYRIDEPVQFTYHAAAEANPVIMLERVTPGSPIRPRVRHPAPAPFGSVRLPNDQLSAGHYEVSLLDTEGWTVSESEFWILEADQKPVLEVRGTSFTTGDALPLAWSGAPGNRHDWIGIFPAPNQDTHDSNQDSNQDTHQPDEDSHQYLTYGYVGARSSGGMRLDANTAEADWPLRPGDYVARLLLDDGYKVLAESARFTITSEE